MRGSGDIHAPSQAAEKRKGNKLAVRRYRKKKQELKSLLDENAYLKERVRKLEGALEQKLEGDDLFSCLRKEDSLKLEKLSTLVATINAMTAAQQPSSAVGQSLGQSGTGSDQTQCKSA